MVDLLAKGKSNSNLFLFDSNYWTNNEVLNSTDPADAPAQNQILRDHGLSFTVQGGANDWADTAALTGQAKQNVTINGVAPTLTAIGDTNTGELWYVVPQGSTIAFDWLLALQAITP